MLTAIILLDLCQNQFQDWKGQGSAIGLQSAVWSELDEYDRVFLARPVGDPVVQANETRTCLYAKQRAFVIKSSDLEIGSTVTVFYSIPRMTGQRSVSPSDLPIQQVRLLDRPHLFIGRAATTTVEFGDLRQLGTAGPFSVTVGASNDQNIVAKCIWQSDDIAWTDEPKRGKWLLGSIVQTLRYMSLSGLRLGCYFLANLTWGPDLRGGAWNVVSDQSDRGWLYRKLVDGRTEIEQGLSPLAKLYWTQAIAGVEIRDPLRPNAQPGSSELAELVLLVIQSGTPFDAIDVEHMMTFGSAHDSPAKERLVLEIARLANDAALKRKALLWIEKLEEPMDQRTYFQGVLLLAAPDRHLGYANLAKWLGITSPEIKPLKNGTVIVGTEDEESVRAAIAARLGL